MTIKENIKAAKILELITWHIIMYKQYIIINIDNLQKKKMCLS